MPGNPDNASSACFYPPKAVFALVNQWYDMPPNKFRKFLIGSTPFLKGVVGGGAKPHDLAPET